jgi:hypothetical protein
MKRKQRKHFKIYAKPVPNSGTKAANPLERAAIQELAQYKMEQASAFVEAQRGKYPQALTPEQKAGPFKEPYTAKLLAEIESGEASVRAIAKMKQTEDDLMRLGVWEYSPYYTSISEALSIVKPESGSQHQGPKSQPKPSRDADFEDWLSRNYLRALKMSIESQDEWLKYLQEVVGVDTSGYPAQDTSVPELGITYRQVFFPDALKERFDQWLQEEYLPRHCRKPKD